MEIKSDPAEIAISWLKQNLKNVEFGELGIILTFHNGQIKRFETLMNMKTQVKGE